jgi:prepilin-type N-terminal cleavage/methylation domain-containing protein
MQTTHHKLNRSGYTLLEMLLVLGLLVVLAGFSAPHLMTAFRDNQLKESAENVRVMMSGSRIRAMDTDSIWQFRYEPGGRHYLRVPYEILGDPAKVNSMKDADELPKTMQFDGSQTAHQKLAPELLEGLPDSRNLTSINWSTPILFFPDGTATDVEFQVVAKDGGVRRVIVREMTGAVSVKKLETIDRSFKRR